MVELYVGHPETAEARGEVEHLYLGQGEATPGEEVLVDAQHHPICSGVSSQDVPQAVQVRNVQGPPEGTEELVQGPHAEGQQEAQDESGEAPGVDVGGLPVDIVVAEDGDHEGTSEHDEGELVEPRGSDGEHGEAQGHEGIRQGELGPALDAEGEQLGGPVAGRDPAETPQDAALVYQLPGKPKQTQMSAWGGEGGRTRRSM